MTIEQAVVRFIEVYLVAFSLVAAFFLAVGVLLGCWIGVAWQRNRRVGRQVPSSDEDLLDVGRAAGVVPPYEPGVARVGGVG